MKMLKYIIFTLVLFMSVNVYAYKFDNTAKIYDYANVIKESEKAKLKEKVVNYIKKNNIDMIIITVKHYSKDNLNDYMNEFYTINNLGIDQSAILLVFDVENDNIEINTYGKAKELYKDFEIKDILSTINGEKTYYKKINKFINLSKEYASYDSRDLKSNMIIKSINWFGITVISLLVSIFIPFLTLIKSNKINKKEGLYINKDSLVINKKSDKFITTTTKQISKKEK